MVRIYKDNDNKYVTKGAYETFYKPLGYKIVLDIEPQKIEETKEEIKVQLDKVVRPARRTRGSSNKKNIEGGSNDLSDLE